MTHRLLSLLSQIEDALRQSDPDTVGPLRSTRSVNYQKGLARLTMQTSDGTKWGSVAVQGYRLANGETCLKLAMTCGRADGARSISIYPRENHDWVNEARKIAVLWLEDAQAATAEEPAIEHLQAATG